MAKKKSAKKSTRPWKCSHGCKVTKTPCEHLEALLPKPETGNSRQVKLRYMADPESLGVFNPDFFLAGGPEVEERFVNLLRKFGLGMHEILLLTDRFVHNKTIAEITRDRGYTSTGVTFYIFRIALNTLKERGFHIG